MNAGIYKLIFSKRLNALVVVGEICSSQGKAPGTTRALKRSARGMFQIVKILGMFSSGALLVSSAWAAPAPNALPTGGQVVQGAASISQSNAQMDINQASQRAVINWQTFDVGADAKVHIIQPNQAAVLLNRVVTNKPSEIYGKIDANGQVILVNNNGIIFGKDGSASASSFTATTLDINDQDFMDGKDRYSSNGTQGEIVNHGTIEAKNGGYVALLGAKVTNDGKIITHNGTVALGAADSIAIPMTSSGKIKMQLSAGSINAAVENTKNAVIVTEGGDVYLQAAAVNSAMASIKHSGQIDTSGEQAGKAVLLADNGEITVDGSITANSTNQANKGGDIIIGRDIETGVLAKTTDVSGASLESKKGFVETSAHHLKVDGIKVKAKEWLLDPDDIEITDGALTAGYTSQVSTATITNALNNGTNISLDTATGSTGVNGNILVTSAINATNTTNTDATLTLKANNGIKTNANIIGSTQAGNTGKINVNMTALGAMGNDGSGIKITKDIDVTGSLSINGTANYAGNAGVFIAPAVSGGTQTLKAGGDLTITGTSNIIGTGYGVCISSCGGPYATITNISSTTGKVSITGNTQTSRGVSFGAGTGTHTYNISALTNVEIKGTTQGKLAPVAPATTVTAYGVFENVSAQLNLASTTGSILIDGDASADTLSTSGQGVGLQGNVSFASASTSTISGKGRTTSPTASHGGISIGTTAAPAQIINVTFGDLVISGTGGGYGLTFGNATAGVGSTTISNALGKIAVSGTGSSSFGVGFSGKNNLIANTYTVDGFSGSNIGVQFAGGSTLNTTAPNSSTNYIKGKSTTNYGLAFTGTSTITATGVTSGTPIGTGSSLNLIGESASSVGVLFNVGSITNLKSDNYTVNGLSTSNSAIQFSGELNTTSQNLSTNIIKGKSTSGTGFLFAGTSNLTATGITTGTAVGTGSGLNIAGESVSGVGVMFNALSTTTIKSDNYSVTGDSTSSTASSNGIQVSGTLNLVAPDNSNNILKGTSKTESGILLAGTTGTPTITATNSLVLNGESTSKVGVSFAGTSATGIDVQKLYVNGKSATSNGVQFNNTNKIKAATSYQVNGESVLDGAGVLLVGTLNLDTAINDASGFFGKSAGAAGIGVVLGAKSGFATNPATINAKGSFNVNGQSEFIGVRVLNVGSSTIAADRINITGSANTNNAASTIYGVQFQRYPAPVILNATGDININGTITGAGIGSGVGLINSGWGAMAPMITAGGNFTIRGNNRASTGNINAALDVLSGMQVKAGGNIVVQAETNNAAVNAMRFFSSPYSPYSSTNPPVWGNALYGNTSFDTSAGNVLIQANQGGISIDNTIDPTLTSGSLTALTDIKGKNITIDNTGAGMATGAGNLVGSGGTAGGVIGSGSIDTTTGAVVAGTGKASGRNGVNINDTRSITASKNINISGASHNAVGVYNKGVINGQGAVVIKTKATGSGIAFDNVGTITGGSVLLDATSENGFAIYNESTGVISAQGAVELKATATGTTSGTAVNNIGTITGGSVLLDGTSKSEYGVISAGAITSTVADVNIKGTSSANNGSRGVELNAPVLSKLNVSIIGKGNTGHGVYVQKTIDAGGSVKIDGVTGLTSSAYSVAITNATITANGTDGSGHPIAIDIAGNNAVGGASRPAVYLATGTAINNKSNGGSTNISTSQGLVYLQGYTSTNLNPAGATITNDRYAGAINITAGGGSSSSAYISSGRDATITQNSDAGITMTTDGTGNLTVAKIINNGSGDVNIGAGKMLAAGNGAGGQVRTVAGNSVANNGGGKLFVYSGKATTTGTLSVLDNTNFAELYLDSSTNTQNADSNVAYGATISGGAVSQVMFREKVSVNIQDKLNGATFNSTYGDTNTKNGQNAALLSDVQGVLKVANSSSGISNQLTSRMNDANGQAIKFHVSASTVIDNMDGAIQSAAYSTADYLKANTSGYEYSKTNSKYTVDFGANSIMVVVKKLALTGVTITDVRTTYGTAAAAGAVSFSNVQGTGTGTDDVHASASIDSAAYSTSNNLKANSYKQTASSTLSGGDKDNYSFNGFTTSINNYIVDQKDITLTGAAASDKVYDSTDTATLTNAGALTAGAANSTDNKYYSGDDVRATNSGAKFTNGKNVALDSSGNAIAQGVTIQGLALSGDDKANYRVIDATEAMATIFQKAITLTDAAVSSKVYDGTDTATLTNPGALTAGAANSADNKYYSDDDVRATNSGAKFTNGKNVALDSSGNVIAQGVTIQGLALSGNDKNNYKVTLGSNLTAKINPASLILSGGRIYDGTTRVAGSTLGAKGVTVNGVTESFTVTGSGNASNLNSKNASSSAQTLMDVTGLSLGSGMNGAIESNYSGLSKEGSNYVIGQRQLSAELVGSVSKVYDGTTSIDNLTTDHVNVSNWADGEGASVANLSGYYADKNVDANNGTGIVKATIGSLSANSGTDLNNYRLPSADLMARIGKITPTDLTVKVNNSAVFATQTANQAYDQGFSYQGQKNNESVADIFGTNLPTAADRVITGIDANKPLAVGSYINAFGLNKNLTALHGNYNVTVQNGDLNVIAVDKLLISIASQSDVYGNRNAANAGLADTVLAQYVLDKSKDAVGSNVVSLNVSRLADGRWQGVDSTGTNVVFSTLVNSDGHLSTGGYLNVGNYQYNATPTIPRSSVNFNDSYVNGGVLTVTPRLIKTQIPVTKTYDGNDSLIGVDLVAQNTMSGDKIALGGAGRYSQANVGTNLDYSFNGIKPVGADSANYAVTLENQSISGHDGIINPRLLTIEGGSALSKVYDRTTAATIINGKLTGLVAGESLQLLSSGNFRSAEVGKKIPVDVLYRLANGLNGNANNYRVDPNAVFEANIYTDAKQMAADVYINPVPVNPSYKTPEIKPIINELVTTQHQNELIQKQCSLEFSKECNAQLNNYENNAPRYMTFY
jgi:filamentous hemagglutinin family protein